MQQNTVEWLEFRKNKIGASDCPAIMGISPYQTPFELWEEKILGKERDVTDGMKRGQFLESKAREEFEKMTGIGMLPKVVISSEREWQIASLDGISMEGDTFVEIKCPNKEVHQMAENGKLPDHYYAQVQHQMCVVDAKMGFYFSFNGEKGALVEVHRDDKYIENIVKKESDFFECMTNREPPGLIDRDYTIQDNREWMQLSEQWKQISDDLKSLEEKESEIRKLLISMANGRSSKGNGIRVTRSLPRGNVDYKNIPELRGVNLDIYRKTASERWTVAFSK